MKTRLRVRPPSGSAGMSMTIVGVSTSARSRAVFSVSGMDTMNASVPASIASRSSSGENSALVLTSCMSQGTESPYFSVR